MFRAMAGPASPHAAPLRVRIDKWLWAARFYKTRVLAAEAVNAGHVRVNGERVKPARILRVGDRLTIRRGAVEMTVDVLGLSSRRGPASEAQALYRETGASRRAREAEAAARRLEGASRPRRRPDKRARRRIIRFVRRREP